MSNFIYNTKLTKPLLAPLACLALVCAVVGPAQAAPAHAVVTVKDDAKNVDALARRLFALQATGEISHVVWVDKADTAIDGVRSLAVLDFPNESSYRRWMRRDMAGKEGAVEVRRADMLASVGHPQGKGLVKVRVSKPIDSAQDQATYAQTQMAPLMQQEQQARAASDYSLYLVRQEQGESSQAIAVTGYAYSEEDEQAKVAGKQPRSHHARNAAP